MANTVIALKRSDIPFAVPTNLANGELAINYADGKLFYKNTTGDIVEISSGGGGLGGNYYGAVNANGTFLISDTSGDVLTVKQGENIIITGDSITDSFTITANLSSAYELGNAAFDKANVVSSDLANTALAANNYAGAMANAANAYAASLTPDLSPAFNQANAAYAQANAAFDRANLSNDVLYVTAAYDTANAAYTNGNAILTLAQAAFDRANLSNDVLLVDTVWASTNAAYDKANAANLLAYNTGIGANAYTVTVGAAANNWANTKLANTSGVWFNGDLNISNNLSNVSSIIFNTGTNRTPTSPGELTWSQDDSTLHFDMDSPGNVIGHIGQDLFYYVKNQTGSTIPKGTVVRFAGTLGASGRLLIAPAIANNSYPSKYVMGVTAASIANGDDGFVISQGKIRGINTSMFSDGDILYVSPSTAGGFSNTMPSAPNNKITVAAVIKSDAIQGSIEVRVTLGSKINEDELAEINNLTNGDILEYVSANGRFENKNTLVNVYNLANAAFNKANLSNDVLLVDTVWASTNAAFDKANSANVLAYNTGVGANAWANTIAADLANTALSVNAYSEQVGAAGNTFTSLAYDVANAAFDYANTLTSGGATVTVSNTAPGSPTEGNLWWNEDLGKMFIYYTDEDSSQWVEVNPSGGTGGGGGGTSPGPAFSKANAAYALANSALPNTTATLSGNLTVKNSVTLGTSELKGFSHTTASNASVIMDTFTKTTWRSALYNITLTSGTEYHTTQISVIHDDVDAYMTEYGTISTGNNLASFAVAISNTDVRLNITPTFAVTIAKVVRTTNK